MSASVDRRTFTKTIAVALAGAAVPDSNAQKTRRLKVGHTGITWGFNPADAEPAIKDVASLGYHGYESFGNVLEAWEAKGGLDKLLRIESKLPLRSAYCPVNLTDPAVRKDEIAKMVRWAALIKKCGGTVAVIGPNNVKKPEWVFADHNAEHRRGAERDWQGARRGRGGRRPAPAHRHLRRDARGDLRGDGGGRYPLRQVRT